MKTVLMTADYGILMAGSTHTVDDTTADGLVALGKAVSVVVATKPKAKRRRRKK